MNRNRDIRDPQIRFRALMGEAEKHNIEVGIPIKLYFRIAKNLVNSMYSYLDDNDVESAYILAFRFITLFVELLPKHPDYKDVSVDTKKGWKKEVDKTLKGAEKMKQMILEAYRKQEDERQKVEARENELRLKREQEMKHLAEKKWLQEQEKKMNLKEEKYFDDLENFVSGKESNELIIDRSLKPTFENVNKWRTLVVSDGIFANFLKYAESNTRNNIETCGILCGKISGGDLILTTVVLPKQSGNSDSCYTQSEEELYDFVDQRSLITLGWIHTHPTQTAFLSSVDLHTQLSYQIMLAEAVAIVCSPKFNQNLLFSLTQHGMDFLKKCKETGFHPHPSEPKIFEESCHIRLTNDYLIDFFDLR